MKKILTTAFGVTATIAGAVVWLQAAAPIIGPATATPAYVVVNTPTPVVITAQITDAGLIATSVNLLRVDSTGKTVATVGVLYDNGISGDAQAGDKIFSYRLNINESVVGKVHYRVSAAFKGVLQRSLSNVAMVTVDPVRLPPDPGAAGRQTLEGTDSDNDGVRDDLQRFIAYTSPVSEPTRRALTLFVIANQRFISAAPSTGDILLPIVIARHKAQDCLHSSISDASAAIRLQRALRAQLLNTVQRSLAYARADASLSGQFFPPPDPSQGGTACN